MKFSYAKSGIDHDKLCDTANGLRDYREELLSLVEKGGYNKNESSINLVSDEDLIDQVTSIKNFLYTPKLKYIFLVGIGGSNLGVKAVYEALLKYKNHCQIIFVDTIEPDFVDSIGSLASPLEKEEFAVVIASKSGNTMESVVNADVLEAILGEKMIDRTVVVTNAGSSLAKYADLKAYKSLHIPEKVGGRFSVFSAVGLLPLALCGMDIEGLVSGARDMRSRCLLPSVEENPALASASVLFLANSGGINIHDTFLFYPALESLGKWYRQLLAESIGKIKSNEERIGITPTVSIGTNDLHSVAQLYIAGPRDKITTFVYTPAKNIGAVVSKNAIAKNILPFISGKTLKEIFESIYIAVKDTYFAQKMPFMEIDFLELNIKEIGAFMQFKMLEVMYLGKLFGVNTFDQPEVEIYKEKTRQLLSK